MTLSTLMIRRVREAVAIAVDEALASYSGFENLKLRLARGATFEKPLEVSVSIRPANLPKPTRLIGGPA